MLGHGIRVLRGAGELWRRSSRIELSRRAAHGDEGRDRVVYHRAGPEPGPCAGAAGVAVQESLRWAGHDPLHHRRGRGHVPQRVHLAPLRAASGDRRARHPGWRAGVRAGGADRDLAATPRLAALHVVGGPHRGGLRGERRGVFADRVHLGDPRALSVRPQPSTGRPLALRQRVPQQSALGLVWLRARPPGAVRRRTGRGGWRALVLLGRRWRVERRLSRDRARTRAL